MSLVTVNLTEDRALLATDTLVESPGQGRAASASKSAPIPQLHGVLAGRGSLGFLYLVYVNVLAADLSSFDDVGDHLESQLEGVLKQFCRDCEKLGASAEEIREVEAGGHQLFWVGFSHARNEPAIEYFHKRPGSSAFERISDLTCNAGPWEESMSLPDVDSVVHDIDSLHRYASQQIQACKDLPDACVGGQLILYEIGREGISISMRQPIGESGALEAMPGGADDGTARNGAEV